MNRLFITLILALACVACGTKTDSKSDRDLIGEAIAIQMKDSTAISNLLKSGEYASHHSEQYEKAYHPHYRLIEKSIFEDKILPLLR